MQIFKVAELMKGEEIRSWIKIQLVLVLAEDMLEMVVVVEVKIQKKLSAKKLTQLPKNSTMVQKLNQKVQVEPAALMK